MKVFHTCLKHEFFDWNFLHFFDFSTTKSIFNTFPWEFCALSWTVLKRIKNNSIWIKNIRKSSYLMHYDNDLKIWCLSNYVIIFLTIQLQSASSFPSHGSFAPYLKAFWREKKMIKIESKKFRKQVTWSNARPKLRFLDIFWMKNSVKLGQ